MLEIGAGTGANFPYYRVAQKVVATEPDPFMLRRATKRARTARRQIALCQCCSEALPFPARAFDTVVSTLVLCSVVDPAGSLAEIKRVLRPSGTFRFIEHVRGHGILGWLQDCVTPVWRWVGAGCHPNRRTAESITAAGFEIVELEERPLALTPLIIGVATPR